MNTPINPEATYIEGGPKPVVFRKIASHDATVNVLYDFVNLEIAEAHAPKEGKPGDAYVADNIIFVWGGYHDDWVAQGKVGEIWEPAPPTLGKLPESLLQKPGSLFIERPTTPAVSFNMKGNWEDGTPLPEEGAEPGDCYIWEGHCWARTSLHKWKDYGDLSHAATVQFEFLQDNSSPSPATDDLLHELYMRDVRANYPGTFEEWRAQTRYDVAALSQYAGEGQKVASYHQFLNELFQDDVNAGYRGTMDEWRSQNGDLNALLRKATLKSARGDVYIGSPEYLEDQRVRLRKQTLLADSKEHPSLDDVESLLQGALTKLESQESDAAFKALDALKKVKVDLRRRRRNTWLRWMLFWAIVGGVVYGLYKWIPTQVVSGRYTVPKVCSAPFGNGLIQGMRYYDYSYKSLFGIHMTLESTVRESTIVSMNGQEYSIFGLSPRNEDATPEEMAVADKVLKVAEVEVETAPKPPKGKWWRMNIWPSDKGTQPMKPAELYLFASEKFTTMVAYKDFCK